MARKSKYSDDVVARIVQALELGATYELAARYGGISYETFNTWRKVKPAFSEAVERAEGEAVVKWLAKIELAASAGNWQAAAWKLERRYPSQYGRRGNLEIEQKENGALVFNIMPMPAEGNPSDDD